MATKSDVQEADFQKFLVGGETSLDILGKAVTETEVEYKPLPGFEDDIDEKIENNIDCDEVYPGIIIGDLKTAMNKDYLKRIGITHLLNAAEGNRYGFARTNSNFYTDIAIQYLGLPIADLPSMDISQHFQAAVNFIDDAIINGGKVFVHCLMGISRSATCVIAYLMMKQNMLAEDAIRLVRKSRDCRPNQGFLCQLATLDNRLRRHRL